MIGRLSGRLTEIDPPLVLLDVLGVGYEVFVPIRVALELVKLEEETCSLYIHAYFREDAHTLYGFLEKADRELFKALIKVNGVGAKMALGILSEMSAPAFAEVVVSKNISVLKSISGIGAKTAERILVEMRGNVAKWHLGETHTSALRTPIEQEKKQVAFQALVGLGYSSVEAKNVIERFAEQAQSPEELILLSLRAFG